MQKCLVTRKHLSIFKPPAGGEFKLGKNEETKELNQNLI